MPAIEARGLAKRYGRVHALEDLTLRIEEGEVFGFLGPNGAGKTTTIRLLLGLIAPTAGSATVLGRPAGAVAARNAIGYLPGELSLWPDYTGAQTLDLLARLTGRAPARRTALLDQLGLAGPELARKVRTYSDGMKQKIGIVQALQCAPSLVLLDEPTKGLDPLVQQAFYEVIGEARRAGATVFFSSHILPEVERVCDRVAMLRAGRLSGLGGVDDVRRSQRRRVEIVFSRDVDPAEIAGFGQIVERAPARVVLLVTQADLPALVSRLGAMPLADIVAEPPSLEDAFLERYR